jgi:hypothetical protein
MVNSLRLLRDRFKTRQDEMFALAGDGSTLESRRLIALLNEDVNDWYCLLGALHNIIEGMVAAVLLPLAVGAEAIEDRQLSIESGWRAAVRLDALDPRKLSTPEERAAFPDGRRRRIVFLDFDGVLNSEKWIRHHWNNGYKINMREELDGEAVFRVNRLCELTGARIVVSSTWRKSRTVEVLRDILQRHGLLVEVIGKTPNLNCARGHEIQHWMDEHGIPPEDIVILDDDSDMEHLAHRHVKTSFYMGMVDRDVDRAIALLEAT